MILLILEELIGVQFSAFIRWGAGVAWNTKYFDILSHVGWDLNTFAGMKTLDKIVMPEWPDHILVSASDVAKTNSIYTKTIKHNEMKSHLHRQETSLNHVLSIALSIAPDALIARLVARPLGFADDSCFECMNADLDQRYGITANFFQPDGLFLSPESLLALEIKLNAPTTPVQVIKYACMLACEEELSGARKNVGLLYVLPEQRADTLWLQTGLGDSSDAAGLVDRVLANNPPSGLAKHLQIYDIRVRAMLARMHFACISWTWLRDQIVAVEATLSDSDPSQQCYRRLLLGLRAQIEAHDLTGIPATPTG